MKRLGAAAAAAMTFVLAGGPAALATGHVWFIGAVNQGRYVRPATLWLSVDGTLEVHRVHWSRWGGRVAVGSGTAEYHGCTPYCGTALIHHARVKVDLWDVRTCDGQAYYNKITVYKGRSKIPVSYQHWAPC